MLEIYDDIYFMRQALQQAYLAKVEQEVPVGAVIVGGNRIIARAYNQTERLQDVTAHAEILAITAASQFLGSKYLTDCTLYVTLEPCSMCAGALAWAKLSRVVYGASDDRAGFMRFGKGLLHPKTQLEYGVLEAECSSLIRGFFQDKRKRL